jgi:hypothetical protein
MSATTYQMGAGNFTSGLTAEFLGRLTWAQIAGLAGVQRAMVLRDLDNFDLRPEVRVNPILLNRFRPKAQDLVVELGGAPLVLTPRWQSVRPGVAMDLFHRCKEDGTLGGPSMRIVPMDDTMGGKMYVPQADPGLPGLIEFRMPCEAPKEGE